jgi:hypothetical protein
MKQLSKIAFAIITLAAAAVAQAQYGNPYGHSRQSMPSSGTGSNMNSENVGGYRRSNGTYVNPYQRSAPDSTLNNNYSTKGNVNPYTGQPGSRRWSPW